MDPRLLFNGGNRAMWIDRFLRILEMEFLYKNWFQNTNLSIHSPSLLPTDPKFWYWWRLGMVTHAQSRTQRIPFGD